LEASKLPLDVAIFNSTRAAGGDDKIRKYLQAVLVVGGTALTPGYGTRSGKQVRPPLAFLLFFFFFCFCSLYHELYENVKSPHMQYDSEFLFLFLFCFSFRAFPFDWIFLGMVLMIECMCGGAVFFYGRLQAIATPLVQNMEKVQIIPPPKDVDKRVLTWKGASVLGRMEGVTDMWVTSADWVSGEQWVTPLLLGPLTPPLV
jgi:actin-related protein